VAQVLPHLDGKIGGAGMRVPVPNGSITDITAMVRKDTTVEDVNNAFKNAAGSSMKNILLYITDPIVSADIVGNPYSCIFDSLLTSVIGKMVKVVGWYDNEWGYSTRLVDLVELLKY
jgi:glyceraldehyde 3-phosphate dehydrogenase